MKKIIIGLLVVVVVLAGAVLVAPGLINWNKEKSAIESYASDFLGREIKITGDVSLTLLPSPRLAVGGLAIAGIEGGQAPHFLKVKQAEILVAFRPLLSGTLKFESIFVEGPDIVLERLADGRANWIFDAEQPTSAEGESAGGVLSNIDFALQKLTVRNGTVAYQNETAGVREKVENLQFAASVGSLNGPFAAKGDLTTRGEDVAFDVSIDSVAELALIPIAATLGLKGESAGTMKFFGSANLAGDAPDITGDLSVESANLAGLMTALTEAPAPKFFGRPFELTGKAAFAGEALRLTNMAVSFGDVRATGQISANLAVEPMADVKLQAKNINLDKFMAEAGGAGDETADTSAPGQFEWPDLPKELSARFDIKVDGITLNDGLIRQTSVQGVIGDGRLDLTQFRSLLPGGSDIALTGSLMPGTAQPRLKGRLEAASNNLRGLFAWLGVQLDAPAGRLANLVLTADIAGQDDLLQFPKLNLRLDATKIGGSATMRLQARPSFGLNLSADKINFDGYRPLSVGASAEQSKSATNSNVLGSFDTDLKLSVNQLTYQRKAMRGIKVDAQLFQGKLTVRRADIDDIGGGGLSLSGTATNLGGQPTVDMALGAKAANLSTITRFLGVRTPVPASKLRDFALNTSLKGDVSKMRLKGQAKLGRLVLEYNALGLDLMKSPSTDATFNLKHPSVAGFAKQFGLGFAPKSDGEIALSGSVKGNLASLSLDSKLSLAGGRLAAVGSVANISNSPAFKLKLDAYHGDMSAFMGAFGQSYRPLRDGKHELKMAANLEGNPAKFKLAGLNGVLGQTNVQGTVNGDISGKLPYFNMDLKLGELWLQEFIPSKQSGRRAQGEKRWSRHRIDFSPLRSMTADAKVTAALIRFQNIPLQKPNLILKLRGGRLDVAPINANLFGGSLSGEGRMASGSRNNLRLSFKADNLQLKQALTALAGNKRVSGLATLSGNLATSGRSEWEFVKGLSGLVRMRAWDGAIEGMDLKRARDGFKNIANPPLALAQISSAFGKGRTRFLEIKGDWNVDRGIARTKNIASDFEAGYGTTHGTADIPRWRLNLINDLRFSRKNKNPDVSVLVFGPIDAPRYKVNQDLLKRAIGGIIKGDTLKTLKPEEILKNPEDIIKKPADVLKQGLDSILKGGASSGSSTTTTPAPAPAPKPSVDSSGQKGTALPDRTRPRDRTSTTAPDSTTTKPQLTEEELKKRQEERRKRREERRRKREERRKQQQGG